MADTALVFNAIGRDTSVTSTLRRIGSSFRTTASEATSAMRQASAETARLDREIDEAKNSLQALSREFAQADNAVDRLQIARKMARQKAEVKRLMTAKDFLPDADEVFKESAGLGMRMGTGISQSLAKVMSSTGPALAVGLAPALPAVGAAIAGAVVGAAGVGGVVGGVIVAAQDARVQSAGKALGQSLMRDLQSASGPMVGALLGAIDDVRREFGRMGGDISSIFRNSAAFVRPLGEGVTGMLRGIVTGFARANAAAGPVIYMLKTELPQLGTTIGSLFSTLADNAEGGAVALKIAFDVINFSLQGTIGIVNLLAESFDWLRTHGMGGILGALGYFDDLPGKIEPAAGSAMGFKAAMAEVDAATARANIQIRTQQELLDEIREKNLSAFDATTRAAEAIRNQTEAIRKNGGGLDANTKKGRANRDSLVQLARALNQAEDATIAQYGAGQRATTVANNNRAAFIRAAMGAGVAKDAARRLADQLLGIPKTPTSTPRVNSAAAERKARQLSGVLDNAARNRTANIYIRQIGAALNPLASLQSASNRREYGGPVRKNHAYIVGEKRAEVFVPKVDGRILPRVEDYRRGATGGAPFAAAGAGSGGGIRIELAGERAIAELFRLIVRKIGPL